MSVAFSQRCRVLARVSAVLVLVLPVAAAATAGLGQGGEDWFVGPRGRVVAISTDRLEALLAQAPLEGDESEGRRLVVLLPTANGDLGRFSVWEAPVMEAELAARFPRIRTYGGIGIDDPTAMARLDLTPLGFHAMILSPSGTVLVDPDEDTPLEVGTVSTPHQLRSSSPLRCTMGARTDDPGGAPPATYRPRTIAGDQVRTYRVAIAATGEYTAFHGGTVENGLAAVTTVLNRIAGIFYRDASIRLVLVNDNDRIIYTDAESDPYTNDEPRQITVENQENLDRVIGSQSYDLGHVFSTYPQGRGEGRVCEPGQKARGVSGLPEPTPELFAIQLVAHEIGHQFGANHTFNGTTLQCAGRRTGATAWEPGSGSTLMSYAGICGAEDVAELADDYFHTGSLDEIMAWLERGVGAGCGEVVASDNRPPTADAGRRYKLPVETPFALAGAGEDPDGDTLTYTWEQFDLGPPSPPLADDGMRPLFRSFPPVAESTRILPRIKDLRRGRVTIGEILPTTKRSLTFRLTVRDGSGGVARDTVKLLVKDQAGPFRLRAPTRGDVWRIGSEVGVEWEVAGTDRKPIRCRQVDLWLSKDGGRTFPIPLLEGTSNDGFETLIVPPQPTGSARVKVSCLKSIFFAVSAQDFKIRG